MHQGEREQRISFADHQEAIAVLGRNDENFRIVAQCFAAHLTSRGDEIIITGSAGETERIAGLFRDLVFLYREGNQVTTHDVRYAIRMVSEGREAQLRQLFADTVVVTARGRHVKPKTLGQKCYLDSIRDNPVTFGIGPAGTGKTYLAVAMAVFSLKNRAVERIILTRPAVEAGEKLGFLPGDLQEKVDPYLRPLYDSLYDILGVDTFQKYLTKNVIEVAPLAYMRGRTLEDAFIILDEAQNTTPEQMKMFLTRIGFGSKAVVNGDISQIDLPRGQTSGLIDAERVLRRVQGIAHVHFTSADVVRHPLVARIVDAYDAAGTSSRRDQDPA